MKNLMDYMRAIKSIIVLKIIWPPPLVTHFSGSPPDDVNGFNEVVVTLVGIYQTDRTLTSDDVHPGLGHVADGGVTGVTPGVSQGGVLDQQERGGRGACK